MLVVDDDELVRGVARETLERLGYEVLMAVNGQDALQVVNAFRGPIHLILLDMAMPILGGAGAFPLLKQARPETQVIIVSGYEIDPAAQGILDAGAFAFVHKPFRVRGARLARPRSAGRREEAIARPSRIRNPPSGPTCAMNVGPRCGWEGVCP